jgi:hypothetical protein
MSKAKAKMGRPPILNRPTSVNTRLSGALVAAIDGWAATAKVTRSEAMRRLIEAGLKRRPPAKTKD